MDKTEQEMMDFPAGAKRRMLEQIRLRYQVVETLFPGGWEAGLCPGVNFGASNEVVVRPAGEFPHGAWVCDCGRLGEVGTYAKAEFIAHAKDDIGVLLWLLEEERGP